DPDALGPSVVVPQPPLPFRRRAERELGEAVVGIHTCRLLPVSGAWRLASVSGGAGWRRPLIGEETELAEKVHLVEEQVLGLQSVAVCRIDRRPPELNCSSPWLAIAL